MIIAIILVNNNSTYSCRDGSLCSCFLKPLTPSAKREKKGTIGEAPEHSDLVAVVFFFFWLFLGHREHITRLFLIFNGE